MREAARIAYVRADHCSALRRAQHAHSRPHRLKFSIGDWVMVWKDSRSEEGRWHGPARVLMVEQNAIWVSHMTRLIRIAPEHVRLLSNHEQLVARSIQELGSSPNQGSGVFQYQDLSQQSGQRPTESVSDPSPDSASFRQPDPQTAGKQSEPTEGERPRPASVGTAPQPDTEPDLELPTTPNNPETLMPDASLIPIPPKSDDELTVDSIDFDTWKIHGVF